MKTTLSEILIAASAVAAFVLGFPLLRAVWLLAHLTLGEYTFVVASFAGFARSLPVALLPVALYAAGFILDRRVSWSRFGRLGFAVQVVYGLLLVGGSIYIYHVAHTFDPTAS